jgi:oxygen-independent coproporphyrinogen III oxidase
MNEQVRPNAGLYIHVPFCGRKCLYCDFYSKIAKPGEIEAYIDALGVEASLRADDGYDKYVYDSIFLGGGTPSLLNVSLIKGLFRHIRANFDIAPNAEITIECNPTSIQNELLRVYRELGINRISLGVQSFNDKHLETLGRLHDSAEAIASFKEIRLAGFANISIDLIYGLPAQSVDEWRDDLAQAMKLGPTHISAYNLIIEPGTHFGKLYAQGKLELPSEEIQGEMYEALNNDLGVAGFGRYELSNFAKPGFECKHNLKYWRLEPYLGLGPSAVSFDGEKRARNVSNLDSYLRAASGKEPPPHEDEILSLEKLREEAIMMGLRLTEGLSCTLLRERFGYDILRDKTEVITGLIDSGYITLNDDRLKLTAQSLFISDEVIVRMI